MSGVARAELEPWRPVDFESVRPKLACHRFDMRFLISNATPLYRENMRSSFRSWNSREAVPLVSRYTCGTFAPGWGRVVARAE